MKKIFSAVIITLVTVYLIIAITAFNVQPAGQICKDIQLVIKDSVNAGFVTKNEVAALLNKNELNPVGKPMEEVVCKTMEEVLATHPLIDGVECYKTPNGNIAVEVTQRVPLLRIMARNGEN